MACTQTLLPCANAPHRCVIQIFPAHGNAEEKDGSTENQTTTPRISRP